MVSLCTREDSAQPNNWGPSSWDHLKKCPQKSTSPKIGDWKEKDSRVAVGTAVAFPHRDGIMFNSGQYVNDWTCSCSRKHIGVIRANGPVSITMCCIAALELVMLAYFAWFPKTYALGMICPGKKSYQAVSCIFAYMDVIGIWTSSTFTSIFIQKLGWMTDNIFGLNCKPCWHVFPNAITSPSWETGTLRYGRLHLRWDWTHSYGRRLVVGGPIIQIPTLCTISYNILIWLQWTRGMLLLGLRIYLAIRFPGLILLFVVVAIQMTLPDRYNTLMNSPWTASLGLIISH